MKHYTIPFFIIHEGCPNQCVFCDQNKITCMKKVEPEDIPAKVGTYLKTMHGDNNSIEVGFFGGSFTAIDKEYQDNLLNPVQPFIKDGKITGIRLSTRPDYIDEEILMYLVEKKVSCIELGVQSMCDKVLVISKRGHTTNDVVEASRLILDKGIVLGHQIMVGLPGSREEDEYFTAKKVKELGATEVRIYPVLVMKNTELAQKWCSREYEPLSEQKAVNRCAHIVMFFELNNIKVIRCGLHPSQGLLDGSSYLAGPFHPAFGEKVKSRIMKYYLKYIIANCLDVRAIEFNPKDKGAFLGFKGENKSLIATIGVECYANKNVQRGDLSIVFADKKLKLNNESVARQVLPDILKPEAYIYDNNS